jgi:hypothetical protein
VSSDIEAQQRTWRMHGIMRRLSQHDREREARYAKGDFAPPVVPSQAVIPLPTRTVTPSAASTHLEAPGGIWLGAGDTLQVGDVWHSTMGQWSAALEGSDYTPEVLQAGDRDVGRVLTSLDEVWGRYLRPCAPPARDVQDRDTWQTPSIP